MRRKASSWKDFLKDAKGVFNIFTCIALLSGITLVTSPLVCRLASWQPLSKEELTTLTLIYCISALSDYMLAIYLNKMPNTVNVDEATVNMSTEATAEEILEPINESDQK